MRRSGRGATASLGRSRQRPVCSMWHSLNERLPLPALKKAMSFRRALCHGTPSLSEELPVPAVLRLQHPCNLSLSLSLSLSPPLVLSLFICISAFIFGFLFLFLYCLLVFVSPPLSISCSSQQPSEQDPHMGVLVRNPDTYAQSCHFSGPVKDRPLTLTAVMTAVIVL